MQGNPDTDCCHVRVIWTLDVGKQIVGGAFVHIANIAVAMMLEAADDVGNASNQCVWYFLNFAVDCTLGVVIVAVVHEVLRQAVICVYHRSNRRASALYEIGFYGSPPSTSHWIQQLKLWIASLALNKLVVLSLLIYAKDAMIDFGNALFSPLKAHPKAELVVVMVICPWLLQTLQFWLFDWLLKAKSNARNEQFEPLSTKAVTEVVIS